MIVGLGNPGSKYDKAVQVKAPVLDDVNHVAPLVLAEVGAGRVVAAAVQQHDVALARLGDVAL